MEEPESLIGITMKTKPQMQASRLDCWTKNIQVIMEHHFPDREVEMVKKAEVVDALTHDYDEKWYQCLWKKNDQGQLGAALKWYRKVKPGVKKEQYQDGPLTDVQRAIARICIAGHGLHSETLKWQGVKHAHRLCTRCDNQKVGGVFHLFSCPDNDRFRSPSLKKNTTVKLVVGIG